MIKLTSNTDRRYALRKAIEQAAEDRIDDLWTWDEDKINRYYNNLYNGDLSMEVDLTHPDIQPSHRLPQQIMDTNQEE